MDTVNYMHILGKRHYELRGQTGNVLATITDRKLPHDPDNGTLTDYYTGYLISASDYPFGFKLFI